jgi:branched-chain amino acid transport system permease protein
VIAVGALVSVTSEVLVFRRLREANPATMMIASFALGFVLQNLLLVLYSSRPKSLSILPGLARQVEVMGARIPLLQVVTIFATLAVLIALTAFLKRTRFGLEMRAAAEDFTMARMLGVRANRVILLAFAISGALAGAIGLVVVVQTGTADINMGLSVMLVAFIATVIGAWATYGARWRRDSDRWRERADAGGPAARRAALPRRLRLRAGDRVLIWRPQGLFAPRAAKQRI